METGLVIQVPSFINKGDVIKIDTEEKKYVGRVTKEYFTFSMPSLPLNSSNTNCDHVSDS